MEKFVFKNKNISYFPKVLYSLVFNYGLCVFKSFKISNTLTFISSTKEIAVFLVALYLGLRFYPKPKVNKKKKAE